jgi:hypothetical protein
MDYIWALFLEQERQITVGSSASRQLRYILGAPQIAVTDRGDFNPINRLKRTDMRA